MDKGNNCMNVPPLGLYIHLPWCVRKCPYCDFNSHKAEGSFDEESYVKALLLDLDQELIGVEGRAIETVFFGGGPRVFSVARPLMRSFQGSGPVRIS